MLAIKLTNNLRYVGVGQVQVNRYLFFLISSHLPDHNHTVKLSQKCGFCSEGAAACCGGREGWRHLKRSVIDQVLHFNFNYTHTAKAERLSGLASSHCASSWQCHHLGVSPYQAIMRAWPSTAGSSHTEHPAQRAGGTQSFSPRVPGAAQCRAAPHI